MKYLRPILRSQAQLRSASSPLLKSQPTAVLSAITVASIRPFHQPARPEPPTVPSPTPFVPDVQTFLTLIGRGLAQHSSKFESWEALFKLSSAQIQELGIEPARTRRYLLQWRQRFRVGQFGVGGDLKHVENGQADLKVLEDQHDPINITKFVVNVPAGTSVKDSPREELSRVQGFKVQGAKTIVGPYAQPLKNGDGARLTVTEGMWEDRRGHKIDGGERRRTMIRYKKRLAERREARERGEIP